MLDGRIQLSNNLAEQSVKPFVIGIERIGYFLIQLTVPKHQPQFIA